MLRLGLGWIKKQPKPGDPMRFTVKQGKERGDEERAEQKYFHVWKCKGTDSNGAKNGRKA